MPFVFCNSVPGIRWPNS